MTVSDEVKREFIEEMPRSTCCRKAFAYGLLFDADVNGDEVSFEVSGTDLADFCIKLLERQFSKKVTFSEVSKAGRKYTRLSLCFPSVAGKVSVLSSESASLKDYIEYKCGECRCCFLRGIFLARGGCIERKSKSILRGRPRAASCRG